MDYKALVDDTRRRFSLNYLRDRKNSLTEIAYLLGYSEVSAFNRAFKRWTGSTPSTTSGRSDEVRPAPSAGARRWCRGRVLALVERRERAAAWRS